MTRARLAPAALTLLALAFASAVWSEAPRLIAALGLGRYDLLLRVILLFAALSLAERLVSRLFPGPQGQSQDPHDDH